ncbi:MAG TPA: hypothetical protein VEZ90_17825, partial [Blastocatellia bacterium]|nr:hypothetical protein [Blastocatellia bacterium]
MCTISATVLLNERDDDAATPTRSPAFPDLDLGAASSRTQRETVEQLHRLDRAQAIAGFLQVSSLLPVLARALRGYAAIRGARYTAKTDSCQFEASSSRQPPANSNLNAAVKGGARPA